MIKLSILCAMALVLGVVGIANGDFGNWSFENGLSGISVQSSQRDVINLVSLRLVF